MQFIILSRLIRMSTYTYMLPRILINLILSLFQYFVSFDKLDGIYNLFYSIMPRLETFSIHNDLSLHNWLKYTSRIYSQSIIYTFGVITMMPLFVKQVPKYLTTTKGVLPPVSSPSILFHGLGLPSSSSSSLHVTNNYLST